MQKNTKLVIYCAVNPYCSNNFSEYSPRGFENAILEFSGIAYYPINSCFYNRNNYWLLSAENYRRIKNKEFSRKQPLNIRYHG